MSPKLAKVAFIVSALLPEKLRIRFFNSVLKWDIDASARISRLTLINAEHVKMGRNSRIGACTVIKELHTVLLGDEASIGRLNWITGFPRYGKIHFAHVAGRDPSLVIGDHSSITNRHLIDCTDRFEIGRFSTFAGFRSQVLTHSIDLGLSIQSCKPISIGDYSFVGTGCVLLGGASIPSFAIVAAGSVVTDELHEERALYGGIPARMLKALEGIQYFDRKVGRVE